VPDAVGGWIWPTSGYRVLIEYEGDQHRSDKRQWNRDIDRYEDFGRAGYLVVRITAERARYPYLVVRLVDEALRAGGYRGPDPVFDEQWMRLFTH
jgi:very-short-patch-repair endonuclease